MHAFLQKPFAESELLTSILKILPEESEKSGDGAVTQNTSIDLDELERMAGGDTDFFDEMLRIFIRSSEEALVKFQLNLQNSDWVAITESAHKLAAPAKHLQATVLYDHLKKLENRTENTHPDEIKKLIDLIDQEIKHINSILKQKLKEY
jgi:HPt (histidine-containing phosphotransfer) domain-containing protein